MGRAGVHDESPPTPLLQRGDLMGGTGGRSLCAGLPNVYRNTAGYAGSHALNVAAWPRYTPSASIRFQTVALLMRKRFPVREMRMPA